MRLFFTESVRVQIGIAKVHIAALAASVLFWALAGFDVACAEEQTIDFGRDIQPLLSENCFHCHGPDRNQAESELRLDRRESAFEDLGGYRAIVPGNTGESELYNRVSSKDDDELMPPADSGRKLEAKEIDLLRRWIEEGASWGEHWSFVSPRRPAPPTVENAKWPKTPLDRFVLARLEKERLAPSPEAAKETLIRRVTLDLTGLPPTLEEVAAFLADESPHAYEKVVDRLLASPRYGEQMAMEWLDAARYADTNGYQRDGTRTMWPWRDWVVRVMNENMPFDQFTVEQIAGDLLPNATRDQRLASGFHRNHMLNGEGGRDPEESRIEYVVDRVDTTAAVWLGLTAGCARCHDHKYDPVSQREYYQLFSYFNNVTEKGGVDRGGNAVPVMKLPTAEQIEQKSRIAARLKTLNRQIEEESGKQALARWEERLRVQLERQEEFVWNPLAPTRFVSLENADMSLDEEGAVFVSGNNPINDTYTIETKLDAARITGIQLEALPHPSFTAGGFARSNSGNFVLSEVEVELQEQGKDPVPLKIRAAEADYHQGKYKIEGTFDGDPQTGWAVLSKDMTKKRFAVFAFEKPTQVKAGATLVVRLSHQTNHEHHNLGRFRLSTTSNPDPLPKDMKPVPVEIVEILDTKKAERSEEQRKAILKFFKKTDPRIKKIQSEIAAAKESLKTLESSILETMVMEELNEPRDTYVLVRGAWDNPDRSKKLKPGVPEVFPSPPENAPQNRLGLAQWLVDPANPLVARVAVNRFWQRFFGVGLVGTPEDFGIQGDRPSHPELLDWLATEFVRSGWDVKATHRLIVTSATYRQSSNVSKERLEHDLYNRLLARGARFRLSSGTIRDQALSLSGLLVNKVGGEPVKPYQPAGVWSEMTLGKIQYEQGHGEDLYRRSLYTFWRRTVGPTLFFDASSRQVCTVRAGRTNTPLHALTLLNAVTYLETARCLAERMMKEGGQTPEEQVAWAFQLATARRPTAEEQQALMETFEKANKRFEENKMAAKELLNIGESPRDASLDLVRHAALTGVANVILNLDEVMTRE